MTTFFRSGLSLVFLPCFCFSLLYFVSSVLKHFALPLIQTPVEPPGLLEALPETGVTFQLSPQKFQPELHLP